MLQRADADGDQAVSLAEFTAAADRRFARMDADGDGQVTQEERRAGREQRKGRRGS